MNEVLENKILSVISQSTCFGIAYDSTVPECKQCDVCDQCKKKSAGANIPTPQGRQKESPKPEETSKKEDTTTPAKPKSTSTPKPASKPKASTKPSSGKAEPKKLSADAPNFKDLTLEQLKELAEQRSVEWSDYGNDSITRMRLIMSLKKTYEIK